MNNRGQTLVLFIIFIPIFIILAAFIVDTGLIIKESTRLKATTKTILKNTQTKKEEDIIKLFKENKIETSNLEIIFKEDSVRIKNFYNIESMFGKIIGLKEYKIKIDLTMKQDEGKVKIEKE